MAPQHELSNEVLNLAQDTKGFVERSASFLKERELNGVVRIFFKNGRLLLELILHQCKIDVTYSLLNEELSTQVILLTSTIGGTADFTLSWFSAGAALVAPPVLISTSLIRSLLQQVINQRNYSKFKKLITRLLDDEEMKQTLKVIFEEGVIPKTTLIEMKSFDSDKNYVPKFNFESDQNLEEFIKEKMEKELGLVENLTHTQIEEIIRNKIKKKSRAKVVYFKYFIDERAGFLDSDIIDAEIIENPIKVKIRDEEL